jgi:hypothetical protein
MRPPNEEFFTLFSEARSDIVERVAIPLAARSGSVFAAGVIARNGWTKRPVGRRNGSPGLSTARCRGVVHARESPFS